MEGKLDIIFGTITIFSMSSTQLARYVPEVLCSMLNSFTSKLLDETFMYINYEFNSLTSKLYETFLKEGNSTSISQK